MKAENCRIRKGSELSVILDYGNVALVDSFLNGKNEIINEKKYPRAKTIISIPLNYWMEFYTWIKSPC